jgi:hypothetical protein
MVGWVVIRWTRGTLVAENHRVTHDVVISCICRQILQQGIIEYACNTRHTQKLSRLEDKNQSTMSTQNRHMPAMEYSTKNLIFFLTISYLLLTQLETFRVSTFKV